MKRVSHFLSRRFLMSLQKGRQKIFWAFLGVFLASFFVVVSLGVLSGYQDAYQQAMTRFNAHIIISKDSGIDLADQVNLQDFFSEIGKEFKFSVTPYYYHETLAPSKKGFQPIVFKGIDGDAFFEMYPFVFGDITSKKLSDPYLGKFILDWQSQTKEKKRLRVLSLNHKQDGLKTEWMHLKVGGAFESGLYHYDNQYALWNLADLKKKFAIDSDQVHGYEVRLADLNLLEPWRESFLNRFGGYFIFTTWDEINGSLLEALKIERFTVMFIAFLVVLVASLNIFGFNFLFFLFKKREFRLLHVLGLPRREVFSVMQRMSLVMGLLATFLACVLGVLLLTYLKYGKGIPLDPEIYFVDRIPVKLEWFWFFGFLFGSLALCWLSSRLASQILVPRFWGQRIR